MYEALVLTKALLLAEALEAKPSQTIIKKEAAQYIETASLFSVVELLG